MCLVFCKNLHGTLLRHALLQCLLVITVITGCILYIIIRVKVYLKWRLKLIVMISLSIHMMTNWQWSLQVGECNSVCRVLCSCARVMSQESVALCHCSYLLQIFTAFLVWSIFVRLGCAALWLLYLKVHGHGQTHSHNLCRFKLDI